MKIQLHDILRHTLSVQATDRILGKELCKDAFQILLEITRGFKLDKKKVRGYYTKFQSFIPDMSYAEFVAAIERARFKRQIRKARNRSRHADTWIAIPFKGPLGVKCKGLMFAINRLYPLPESRYSAIAQKRKGPQTRFFIPGMRPPKSDHDFKKTYLIIGKHEATKRARIR